MVAVKAAAVSQNASPLALRTSPSAPFPAKERSILGSLPWQLPSRPTERIMCKCRYKGEPIYGSFIRVYDNRPILKRNISNTADNICVVAVKNALCRP